MSVRLVLNGGEVSSSMYGRSDVAVYHRAAERCNNFIVEMEGGIHRRGGLAVVDGCHSDDRIFSFRYDGDENFVLLLNAAGFKVYSTGNYAKRVYQFEGDVAWADYVENLVVMQVNDVVWVCGLGFMPQQILRKGEEWEVKAMEFGAMPMSETLVTNGMGWAVDGYGFDQITLKGSGAVLGGLGLGVGDSMSVGVSRDELRYPDLGVSVRRCALKPSPYGGIRGDLTGKLSTAPVNVGWTFYQLVDGWYRYYTCTKQWQTSYATLGQDARAYPEYFMAGIIGGIPEFGILTKRSLIIDANTNFAKKVTYKAGSWALVYAGQSIDSIYNYYIYFKRDFKMWPNKDGGDVVWTYDQDDRDWSWVGDQINYPDTWQRVDAGVRLDLPFYVQGPWTVTSEGAWDAEWEIRRSYDVGLNPVLNPDPDLSVSGRAGYYHRSWDVVRNFSQGVAGERKNVSISLMEAELCLIGVFLMRSKALTAASMGVVNFSYDESSEVADCRVSLIADDGTIKLETPRELYDLAASGTSREVRMGEFCSARGYPRCVALHQGRLWFGGTRFSPTGLWGSVVDDYTNFRAGDNDDDALSVSLAGRDQCGITWMSSQRHLLVGTEGAEWVLAGGQDGVIKPSSVTARVQSRVGSFGVRAACDSMSGVIYVAAGGKRVNELGYSWEAESYVPRDISLYSSHILGAGGASRVVLQRVPDVRAWVVRFDGRVACCSLSTGENVSAWAVHEFADGGLAYDACVAAGDDGMEDVWFVVRRKGAESFLCRLGEDEYYVDYWRAISPGITDVSRSAKYVSEYVSTRLEQPQSASGKNGAVRLYLDVDCSQTRGVAVSLDALVWRSMPSHVGVADGWAESGVSGTFARGIKFAVRVSGEDAFALRAVKIG